MCDTKLRGQTYSGEKIDHFLRKAIMPSKQFKTPALTVPTLQRLIGHLDHSWISPDVMDRLVELQSGEAPGTDLEHQLIAPALRTIDDFRGCGSVVVRIAGASSELWQHSDEPLLDEENGRVYVVIDDLVRVGIDPRSPTIWTAQDYSEIHDRKPMGQGHMDHLARVATYSIKLSGFSSRPKVPERYVSAALRRFTLTGK